MLDVFDDGELEYQARGVVEFRLSDDQTEAFRQIQDSFKILVYRWSRFIMKFIPKLP